MIKKVVIPAAGLGTRFLPITKSFAKEMLPIIDKPNLQYLLEECKNSGIEEAILIVSQTKDEIIDFFSHNEVLENQLRDTGKEDEYKLVYELGEFMKITFVIQEKPLGLGHAILCAKDAVNGEDFAVLLGDDLVYSKNKPAILQLIEQYEKYNASVIGVQKVPHEHVCKYGIIDIKDSPEENLFSVNTFVEKPKVEDAPSDFACVGRYVFKNSIFNELENVKRGKGGEYQLTDAMITLLNKENMLAYNFEGIRYDIGSKEGYIKAIIDYSLRRRDLKDNILNYIKQKVEE